MATIVALMLLALVGAALAGLTQRLAADGRAARTVLGRSQTDQLLMAGAIAARGMLPPANEAGKGRTGTFNVALPPELADRAGLVTIRSEAGPGRVSWIFHIEVNIDGRSASQTLRFGRTRLGWAPAEAALGTRN
jgi:hypothetical protein